MGQVRLEEVSGGQAHGPGDGAVISGGTSGIGLEIAVRLARQGRAVYVWSRTAATRREELGISTGNGPQKGLNFVDVDVTEPEALANAAAELVDRRVCPGVVVTSAGVNVRQLALEIADDDARRVLEVNLYGTFATFKALAPLVLSRPGGRFLAISSLSAVHGQRLRAPYGASKAGVSGLVRGLAVEWGPFGATVNAIAPGILDTPMTREYMQQNPERVEEVLAHTPLGRLGDVGDVASVAEFLISDRAGFVTGQTIIVDGGISAGSSWW